MQEYVMLFTMSPQVLRCLTSLALPKADARESSAFYGGAGERTSDYFGIKAQSCYLSDYAKVGVAGGANGARLSILDHNRRIDSSGARAHQSKYRLG
jgi:hypothetical protein